MDFVIYLIIAVVIIALIIGAVLFIQARRRKGGVIVDPARPAGRGSKKGKA